MLTASRVQAASLQLNPPATLHGMTAVAVRNMLQSGHEDLDLKLEKQTAESLYQEAFGSTPAPVSLRAMHGRLVTTDVSSAAPPTAAKYHPPWNAVNEAAPRPGPLSREGSAKEQHLHAEPRSLGLTGTRRQIQSHYSFLVPDQLWPCRAGQQPLCTGFERLRAMIRCLDLDLCQRLTTPQLLTSESEIRWRWCANRVQDPRSRRKMLNSRCATIPSCWAEKRNICVPAIPNSSASLSETK